MKAEEIAGVIRAVLSAVGGILVTKGYLDQSTMLAIVGALVVLVQAGWSVYAKKTAAA